MLIEFHDAEVGHSLSATMVIDYDYQAEQAVQDIVNFPGEEIVMVILKDDHGDRCVWERQPTGMTMVMRTQRFTGKWAVGVTYERKPTSSGPG